MRRRDGTWCEEKKKRRFFFEEKEVGSFSRVSLERKKKCGSVEDFEKSGGGLLFSRRQFPTPVLPFTPSKYFRGLAFNLTKLDNHSDYERGTLKRFGAASQIDNLQQKETKRVSSLDLRSISPAREQASKGN